MVGWWWGGSEGVVRECRRSAGVREERVEREEQRGEGGKRERSGTGGAERTGRRGEER